MTNELDKTRVQRLTPKERTGQNLFDGGLAELDAIQQLLNRTKRRVLKPWLRPGRARLRDYRRPWLRSAERWTAVVLVAGDPRAYSYGRAIASHAVRHDPLRCHGAALPLIPCDRRAVNTKAAGLSAALTVPHGWQKTFETHAVVPVTEQVTIDEHNLLACPQLPTLLGEPPSGGDEHRDVSIVDGAHSAQEPLDIRARHRAARLIALALDDDAAAIGGFGNDVGTEIARPAAMLVDLETVAVAQSGDELLELAGGHRVDVRQALMPRGAFQIIQTLPLSVLLSLTSTH